MKILLDAGHGGKDPGAVNPRIGRREKDIALEVVLKLSAFLRGKGYPVLLTRDRDVNLSPADRLKMIKQYSPEVFISVHCNSALSASACGIETIYRDDYDYPLAAACHKALIAATELRDRGIKQDIKDLGRRLAVLGELKTPACLVEIGFISSEADLQILENEDLYASALAQGIEEYRKGRFV